MNKAEKSVAEIAETLGRDPSTIYRELSRNTGGRGYRPKQRLYQERRERCRRPRKMEHGPLKQYVTKTLRKK